MEFNLDEKLNEHLDAVSRHFPKNEFFYIGLYGSQNYGLATDKSDVDTKCMILPTSREVILGKPKTSTDVVIPSDDALCNVKDIREMFGNFFKGNINFVEILYTEWALENLHYLDEIQALRDFRDEIATRNVPNLFAMAAGMARQKYVAFEKPFESKLGILAKYGYDPKQLHHLVRLYHFIDDFVGSESFKVALHPTGATKELLISLKTEPLPYDKAKAMREQFMFNIDELVKEKSKQFALPTDAQAKKDENVKEFLDNLAYKVIAKAMAREQLR